VTTAPRCDVVVALLPSSTARSMTTFPMPPRPAALAFLLVLIGSICTSSLIPAMGYFIIEHLGEPAWKVGFYTVLVAVLSLTLTRIYGERLDASASVRLLLISAILAYLAYCLLLSQLTSFLLLLLIGTPLMSLANTANGVAFTFGRLTATREGYDITRVNSWLRMGVSLAWMIGPALTFSLIGLIGFTATYFVSFALGLVWLALWHLTIPRGFRALPRPKTDEDIDGTNWGLWLAGFTVLMFVITNSLALYALPLFALTEIGLTDAAHGLALTVKCGVEVFAIFGAARLSRTFGVRPVLVLSTVLGVASMILFTHVQTLPQLLAVAGLEGLYYGLMAGLGITYVQTFAPDRPGRATAVYMNSLFLGGMIGSVAMGFIASAFDFRSVLFVAAACGLMAAVLLLTTGRYARTTQAA